MAIVPTFKGGVGARPISTEFDSGAGGTPDAFGAAEGRATSNLGRAVDNAGDVGADILIQRQRTANALELNRLQNELSEASRVLQRGDGTEGSQGWRDLKASDSVDGDKEFRDQYLRSRREIEGRIENPKVAQAFGTYADSNQTATFSAMDEHLARETRVASDSADEANIAEMSQAMADDNDIGRNEVRRSRIVIAARDMLDRAGITDQTQRALFVKSRLTVAHEGVINRLLQQDPSAAQVYYDRFKEQVLPLSRAGIEKKLGAGRTLQRAQEIANEVFDPEKSRADMQAEARKAAGDDADVAKAAVQDLVVRQAAHDADKRDAKQAVQKALSDAIKSGSGIPPALAADADADDLVSARRLERQLASREPVKTDYPYFEDMMALTGREAANISLLEAETKLLDKDLATVQRHKIDAIEGLGDNNNPNTPTSMFNTEADILGLSGNGPKARKKRGRFRAMFQDELAKETETKGSQLDSDEVRAILDRITNTVVTDANFFQRLSRGDQGEVLPFANEVPLDARRTIQKAFKDAGLPAPSRFEIARIHITKEPLPLPAAAGGGRKPPPPGGMTPEDRSALTAAYQRAREAGTLGPSAPAEPTEEQLQAEFDRLSGNR